MLSLVTYGFVTGLSHSFWQALSSAVKMPLLFVATMAFCLSVTLFFVLTSENYPFFQLLAVVFVAISGCIGLCFLWRGMTQVDLGGEYAPRLFGRALLGVWIILYAFVGSQMTWRLSPLIGDPERTHFVFLQPSRDDFYVDVIRAFERATGMSRLPSAGGGDIVSMLVLNGFCFSVLCVVALGIGAYAFQRIRAIRQSRSQRPAAGSDVQQSVLDDIALKAKYAPNSGSV